MSFTPLGQKKYIEVKTTGSNAETDFFVTSNELAFSQRHPENYHVYRVYDYNRRIGGETFYDRPGSLDESFSLIPTQFRAKVKHP